MFGSQWGSLFWSVMTSMRSVVRIKKEFLVFYIYFFFIFLTTLFPFPLITVSLVACDRKTKLYSDQRLLPFYKMHRHRQVLPTTRLFCIVRVSFFHLYAVGFFFFPKTIPPRIVQIRWIESSYRGIESQVLRLGYISRSFGLVSPRYTNEFFLADLDALIFSLPPFLHLN